MQLTSRSGLIATVMAIAAIAAPNATAGQGAATSTVSPLAGPLAQQPSSPTPRAVAVSSPSPWAGPLAFSLRSYSGAHATYGSVKVHPTVVRVTAPSDSFDYGDAAIGAGVIVALTLVGAAATLTIRRGGQLRHG